MSKQRIIIQENNIIMKKELKIFVGSIQFLNKQKINTKIIIQK